LALPFKDLESPNPDGKILAANEIALARWSCLKSSRDFAANQSLEEGAGFPLRELLHRRHGSWGFKEGFLMG
jgi:hypothetical protein